MCLVKYHWRDECGRRRVDGPERVSQIGRRQEYGKVDTSMNAVAREKSKENAIHARENNFTEYFIGDHYKF